MFTFEKKRNWLSVIGTLTEYEINERVNQLLSGGKLRIM